MASKEKKPKTIGSPYENDKVAERAIETNKLGLKWTKKCIDTKKEAKNVVIVVASLTFAWIIALLCMFYLTSLFNEVSDLGKNVILGVGISLPLVLLMGSVSVKKDEMYSSCIVQTNYGDTVEL